MSRQKKQNVKKVAVLLGLSGCAVAATTAAAIWAFSPQSNNWTLTPQLLVDTVTPEIAPTRVASQPRNAWVPLNLAPPAAEEPSLPTVDVALETADSGAGPQDYTEARQEGEAAESTGSYRAGYSEPASAGSGGGNYNNHFGMFASAGSFGGMNMGGGGSSWNGTINPNPPYGPRSYGPSSSLGGGSGGGGGGGPINPPNNCAYEPAKSQDPSCTNAGGSFTSGLNNGGSNGGSNGGGSNGGGSNGDGSNGGGSNGGGSNTGGSNTGGSNTGGSNNGGSNGGGSNGGGSNGGGSNGGGSNTGSGPWSCTTSTVNGVTTQYGNCPPNNTATGFTGTMLTTCTTTTVNGVTRQEGDCDAFSPPVGIRFSALQTSSNQDAGDGSIQSLQVTAVPEPSAILVFATALLGLGWLIRRRA